MDAELLKSVVNSGSEPQNEASTFTELTFDELPVVAGGMHICGLIYIGK